MIIKEYLAIKIKQRSAMGWNEVHYDLLWALYCEKQERIVKVFICRNADVAAGMDYVPCVSNMELNTIPAHHSLTLSIMTKAFCNFGERRRQAKDGNTGSSRTSY